jgi:hypothetical protein
MMRSSYKRQLSDSIATLIRGEAEAVNVYVVGSLREDAHTRFSSSLSDVDLLIVPICDSLDDYVSHFEQVININANLNALNNDLFETFFMSSRIAYDYFNILPIIAGDAFLRDKDLLRGFPHVDNGSSLPRPSLAVRKRLYLAKVILFHQEYLTALPVANTTKARKVAKLLLRDLKMIVCGQVEVEELDEVEGRLCAAINFSEVMAIIREQLGVEILVDEILQRAIDGEDIDDWAEWMVAQDTLVRQLMSLRMETVFSAEQSRLYVSMVQVRDLLNKKLKDIFDSSRSTYRVIDIENYANETASVIVKLALAGVSRLISFDDEETPQLIKEAYEVVVEHLQGQVNGLRVLAASVALLEYALEQSIIYANQQ